VEAAARASDDGKRLRRICAGASCYATMCLAGDQFASFDIAIDLSALLRGDALVLE